MRPDEHADRLARITTALVAWVSRRSRAVLLTCFAVVVGAIALSYAKLEYHTQRNDLLSADKACQKRWQKYLDAFGDDDDMVVVAEGNDRDQMKAALDEVAAAVKQRPELFDRVFHRADLRPLADRALLYLPPDQIEAIRDRVGRMDPLLGDFGPLAWKKISVQSLLGNGGVALQKRAEGRELTSAEQDLIALLPAIATSAAAAVRDTHAYRNPWGVTLADPSPQPPPPGGEGELSSPSPRLQRAAETAEAGEARHAGTTGEGSERSERVRGKSDPRTEAHPSPGGEAPPPSPARGEGRNPPPPSFPGKGAGGLGSSASQLTTPQYFFTPDGSLAMLTCRPKKAAQSFTPAKEANDAMRAILADAGSRHPHVTLGLTGLPVLETDEMVMSDVDSTRASWLALAGVAVLYFVVYRGFRYPLLTVGSLVVGTVWALGWATLTVGHLNILSATFAVMLIGLGDYGVLWVAQYDEQRKLGFDANEAMRYTAAHAGPSIVVAALSTSLAFFATMLADFKAVAELGWIAGCGVLFCALACLTALPAALVLLEARRAKCEAKNAKNPSPPPPPPEGEGEKERRCFAPPLPLGEGAGGRGSSLRISPPTLLPFPTAFLPALAVRPRLVLAVGALLLLVCAGFASRLHYDHNLLNLQASGTDSVAWEKKLIDRAAGATWDAMSVAPSRDEALALKAKYEALPEVAKVVEVASLVPDEQERKLPAVAAIHAKLANLPPKEKLPAPSGSNPVAVRELADRVGRLAGGDTALSLATADLARAVSASPDAAARLKAFDRRLSADLATELHALKSVSRPAPIALADVPVELRERFVGAHGEYLVRAFARDSLWDFAALQTFTAAAQTADPEATGKSFRTLEGLRQMKVGFEWAGVYALGAIVLVLALDFRRASGLLLGLFPLAVGIVLTLGLMALCGVPLNPANMIALPLIVGVGVDNGVHVLHDYRARDRRRPYRLGAATGRGVLVAGHTTVLGFGTMLTARHAGMASLGLALTIGVSCCMAASLLLLPAVLHLADRVRLRRENAPVATVLSFEIAKAA